MPPPSLAVVLLVSLCLLSSPKATATGLYQSCPGLPEILWGAPGQVEAMSTGAIKIHPQPFYQNYKSECHTESKRRFRTADGSCNSKYNFGSANTPLTRMLSPEYDDGLNSARSMDSRDLPLPSATDISRVMHSHARRSSQRTLMFMQWGQFTDHDISLSPVTLGEGVDREPHCCRPDGTFPGANFRDLTGFCMPIRVHEGDNRFRDKCLEFSRSIAARTPNGQKLLPREQVNVVTSFLDGSQIYGSSEEVMTQVRHFRSIFMRINGTNGLLPMAKEENCIHKPGEYCFLAGDVRVNEQPGLATIHTIMVKLHNRIARKLREYSNDDEDTIFLTTRKLVVAIIQNIHYKEYLPLVLGENVMKKYDLYPGRRVPYSTNVDPRVNNAFSTAAFRFGHSLIPEFFLISGRRLPLRELFNRPDEVFANFTAMVLSLVDPSVPSEPIDSHIVGEVTNHLFEPEGQVEGAASQGLDLVALNIQRGRDHGLPPYNKFRKICGLKPLSSFKNFDFETAEKLRSLYDSIDDVDLFTGGLLESNEVENIVGPTFACIIAQQFHALKFGDRFYYETHRYPEGFTNAQLDNIRKITLAHVLCFFPRTQIFHSFYERSFETPSKWFEKFQIC